MSALRPLSPAIVQAGMGGEITLRTDLCTTSGSTGHSSWFGFIGAGEFRSPRTQSTPATRVPRPPRPPTACPSSMDNTSETRPAETIIRTAPAGLLRVCRHRMRRASMRCASRDCRPCRPHGPSTTWTALLGDSLRIHAQIKRVVTKTIPRHSQQLAQLVRHVRIAPPLRALPRVHRSRSGCELG